MRFLVTRPQPDCHRTAERIRQLGHDAVEEPMLVMRETLSNVLPNGPFAGLVVTSGRVVELLKNHPQADGLKSLPVFAVGNRSAELMRSAGWQDVRSANGSSGDLVDLILGEPLSGPLLYPAARDRAADLEAVLQECGISCVVVEAYAMEQVANLTKETARDYAAGHYDGVLIYSQRTAEAFLHALQALDPDAVLPRQKVFAISKQAGKPLESRTCVCVSQSPTEDAVLNLALNPG